MSRDDPAVFQVAHETRLIDGIDGPDAHRDRGKLPEILHQPGMRIGGQPRLFAQFVTEVLEVLLVQTAFQIRSRIFARRGMALEVNEISRLVPMPRVEEVVVTHLGQRRSEA